MYLSSSEAVFLLDNEDILTYLLTYSMVQSPA